MAVVTGGGSGIGRGMAHAFADAGMRVVIADIETGAAENVRREVETLGVEGLLIGPEIDPGVPWTVSLEEPRLALALKSGNFGTRDFFMNALEVSP